VAERTKQVAIDISSSPTHNDSADEFDAEGANKGLGSIALATHVQPVNHYAAQKAPIVQTVRDGFGAY
jgi:hypothetical protein